MFKIDVNNQLNAYYDREIDISKGVMPFRSENIVCIHAVQEVYTDRRQAAYVIMDLCQKDLRDYLNSKRDLDFPILERLNFFL